MIHRLSFAEQHCYGPHGPAVTVSAILKAGAGITRLVAAIDTGCSHCVFERGHGELLGLDIEAGEPRVFTTAAGRVETFGHEIEIETLGARVVTTAYFFANPHIAKNLLGRAGWLDRVRLAIVDHDQTLYLAPYDFADV